MKKTGILLALLLLVVTAACACAQELPGVDCFSPGFVELNERMKQGQAVSAEATLTGGACVLRTQSFRAENAFGRHDPELSGRRRYR